MIDAVGADGGGAAAGGAATATTAADDDDDVDDWTRLLRWIRLGFIFFI